MALTPKAKAAKINKWDYIKLKNFCTTKESINKVNRKPMEWEKMLTEHISGKGLISKINEELIQINSKITIWFIKNRQRKWIDIFLKKTYRWPTGAWNRGYYVNSTLIIRELQIKTTVRYHLTLVRMAITEQAMNQTKNNKC